MWKVCTYKLSNFFVVTVLFCCCRCDSRKATITDDVVHIDISKDYPSKAINFNPIRNREYVPLETTDDVLLGMYSYLEFISENYILMVENSAGNIFIFNRIGKIVSFFNHKGQGPEEYNSMWCVVFDEKNEEVFVFDNYGADERGYILVYSILGEYKRRLTYPADFRLTAYNFDDENLLVYDDKYLNKEKYNHCPYMLLSKTDGSITANLNINLPVRYDKKVIIRHTDSSGMHWSYSSSTSVPNKRRCGQDLIIADLSLDTIYRLTKNRDLIPFIVRSPSIHSTDPPIACTPALITDEYIILYIKALDYEAMREEKGIPHKTLMYEFETGEIYTVNYTGYFFDTHIMQKNIDVNLIHAATLKNAFERELKSGNDIIVSLNETDKEKFEKLKKMITNLDDEDNPVVVIDHLSNSN